MTLTKEDLNAIAGLLEVQKTELQKGIDEKFSEQDAILEDRFAEQDAKLEEKFAEQDAKLDERFAEQDAKLEERFAEQDAKLEERFTEQDIRFEGKFNAQKTEFMEMLRKTENSILEEVDRVQEIGERNMKKLEEKIDEMRAYYRINRSDTEERMLLMEMVLKIKEEIEEIKKKIA